MKDEFNYAVETLKIEKYKLEGLLRQIRLNTHEGQTNAFVKEEEKTKEQLKQLDLAIVALERVGKGEHNDPKN